MVRPRGGSRRKLERVVEALDEPVEAQPIAEEVPQAPLRLYAIRSTGSGLFKIGISKHPESRLQELQVGSPIRLEIVSLTDIESPGAEREAHRALASYRLRGEWFDFGPLGEYVAGRLRPKASNLDALVAALREIRGVVIPARTACGLSRDDAAPNDPEPRWARGRPVNSLGHCRKSVTGKDGKSPTFKRYRERPPFPSKLWVTPPAATARLASQWVLSHQ